MFPRCPLKVIICRWAPVHLGERTIELVGEAWQKPSDPTTAPVPAAPPLGWRRCPVSHSSNLPTEHSAQRTQFNTMANTPLPAPACASRIFLYPRASENFSDVSQKLANRRPSSIRTMKSRPPIRSAAERVPANGAWAPPRVIVRSEDTAYRLCALTQPLQTIEIQL